MLAILGTRAGTSLPNLLFWRYLIAAAALALLAARRGSVAPPRPAPMSPSRVARLVLVGGAGQAAVTALSLSALGWISAATLGFLFYTFPAWVTLLAAIRRTDHVDARRGVALGLSLAGIALMVGLPSATGGALGWPGVLLALAAALTYALYIPLLGRITAAVGPVVGSTYVTTGAALFLGGWAVVDGTLSARLPAAAWGSALALALACTVLAFIAFLSGLRVLGPVRAAIVSTVEPFWTAILGAVLLAQPITVPTMLGGALIAAAVMLLQLPPRRAAAPSAAA